MWFKLGTVCFLLVFATLIGCFAYAVSTPPLHLVGLGFLVFVLAPFVLLCRTLWNEACDDNPWGWRQE